MNHAATLATALALLAGPALAQSDPVGPIPTRANLLPHLPALAEPAPPQAPPPPPMAFPPDLVPVPGAPGAYTHPDIPQGRVIIDGDIEVSLADYMVYLAGGDAVFGDVSYWANGVVYYGFNANVTAENRQRAIDGMNAIAARTGVVFVLATATSPYRIQFNDSTVNSSPVGAPGIGGVNTINIASWTSQFTIIHELYHSLGFWHQQSASNRDSYVTINWANISTTACNGDCSHNFNIRSGASLYGGYDFDSFMHYPRWAFQTGPGLDTITVRPPWNAQWQNAIGQRDHFSYLDEIVCRGIYRRSNDYWWQAGASGSGNLNSPIGGTLPGRMNTLPANSNLFIRLSANYSAIGTYSNPITISAPLGATLGN